MKENLLLLVFFIVMALIGIIFGIKQTQEAKKVCKTHSTYMVEGTTYSCDEN